MCDESLYHEIAVIYCFLHLYERMETMEGEALDFITRDFDAWKWRREQRRQSEKKIKKDGLTVSEAWLEYCKTGKMSDKKALKLYRKAMLWYFVCHVKWLFIDSLLLHN